MAAFDGPHVLAPTGSTGNNTHTALQIGADWSSAIVQFIVEAVGATPTVTWKVQQSIDGVNYYDAIYVTDSTDTAAVSTRTATAVGAQLNYLTRPTKFLKLVTSSNTNVTYRAELYRETARI